MAPRSDAPVFDSFWMGGYEGADHVNASGLPLDMARASGHLERMDEDHAAAAAAGLRTVRETIGWRLAEPSRGHFDFGRVVATAQSARRHGLQVLWSLMHNGTPPDLSLFDDALVERFAAFAGAAARVLRTLHDRPPVYTLVNEIGFVAWAVSSTNRFHPYQGDPLRRGDSTEASGYAVKCRLVRAVLAGMAAVKAVDPRARFLHVEPVIHVVAPPGRTELVTMAEQIRAYQWQVWDLLSGRLEPALGGHPGALDLIGVKHHPAGQWEVLTERRLAWRLDDPRRCPLASLLAEVWRRYHRPLIVAETGHFGSDRAEWLDEVAAEALRARAEGVPLKGVCLYPLVDHPDWDQPGRWLHAGLWDVDPAAHLRRRLSSDCAAMLAHWQQRMSEPSALLVEAGALERPAVSRLEHTGAGER